MNSNQSQNSSPQYNKLLYSYCQTQFKDIEKLLRNMAYYSPYNGKYPVLQILKAVCRKMLINQFQGILFTFIVKSNKWNINHQTITSNCCNLNSSLTDGKQCQNLTLYLLLCAYTVKYYSNENMSLYDEQVNNTCANFKEIFDIWAKDQGQTLFKINPKNLNFIYKKIFLKKQQYEVEFDYNSLIDNLLVLSPAVVIPEKILMNKQNDNKQKISTMDQEINKQNYVNFEPTSYYQDLFNQRYCENSMNKFENMSYYEPWKQEIIEIKQQEQKRQPFIKEEYSPVKEQQQQPAYDLIFRKKISSNSGIGQFNLY